MQSTCGDPQVFRIISVRPESLFNTVIDVFHADRNRSFVFRAEILIEAEVQLVATSVPVPWEVSVPSSVASNDIRPCSSHRRWCSHSAAAFWSGGFVSIRTYRIRAARHLA